MGTSDLPEIYARARGPAACLEPHLVAFKAVRKSAKQKLKKHCLYGNFGDMFGFDYAC